jgi:hypothetical protein
MPTSATFNPSIQGNSTMIIDDPSQWTSQDTGKFDVCMQTAVVLFRFYLKKRAGEGRDIQSLRQEMMESSVHPELLRTLFEQAGKTA